MLFRNLKMDSKTCASGLCSWLYRWEQLLPLAMRRSKFSFTPQTLLIQIKFKWQVLLAARAPRPLFHGDEAI